MPPLRRFHGARTRAIVWLLAGAAVGVPAAATAATTTPAPAPAPRNSVTVSVTPPAVYHHGQRFSITLVATLKKHFRHAYLLSFIQYTPRPCQANPNKELTRTLGTKGAYYHHQFSASPFTAASSFTGGAPGARRVCAYLFKKPVAPGTRARAIATGTVTYSVIK